jgi:hypothetical protein
MSSQGPAVTGSVAYNEVCVGPTGGSPQLPAGYSFTTASIRDGSDWIAYKKQALIYNENKAKIHQNQWAEHGNDYRIQYLLGKYKFGGEGCTGCSSNSFGTNGPY